MATRSDVPGKTENAHAEPTSVPPRRVVGRGNGCTNLSATGSPSCAGLLLLAASDMQQAEAAARALEAESENLPLDASFETAMAVCHARAFTTSTLLTLPAAYVPADLDDAELHRTLFESCATSCTPTPTKRAVATHPSPRRPGRGGSVLRDRMERAMDSVPA